MDARLRVREVPLSSRLGWPSRALFVGPEGGDYLFVYSHRQSFIGIPRDHNAEVVTWTPECERPSTLFAQRTRASRAHEVTAYYLCGNESTGPPFWWQATIDLDEGTLSAGVESPADSASLGAVGKIDSRISDDHPGAAIWGSTHTDYRQKLFFLSTTYSRSEVDLRESIRAGNGYPCDAESAVVILDSDGELTYVPVEIDFGSPERGHASGPLHDVINLK